MDYQSPLKLRIKVTNDFNLIKEGIPETQNNLREFTLNMCSLEPLSIPKSIIQASARKGEPVGGVCVCVCVCVCVHAHAHVCCMDSSQRTDLCNGRSLFSHLHKTVVSSSDAEAAQTFRKKGHSQAGPHIYELELPTKI